MYIPPTHQDSSSYERSRSASSNASTLQEGNLNVTSNASTLQERNLNDTPNASTSQEINLNDTPNVSTLQERNLNNTPNGSTLQERSLNHTEVVCFSQTFYFSLLFILWSTTLKVSAFSMDTLPPSLQFQYLSCFCIYACMSTKKFILGR